MMLARSSSSSLAAQLLAAQQSLGQGASSSSSRLLHTTASVWGKSPPGQGRNAIKFKRRMARLGVTSASQIKDTKKESKYESETMRLDEAVRMFQALEVARPLNAYEVHVCTTVESHQTNALRGRLALPNESRTKAERLLIFAEDDSESANAVQSLLDSNPSLKQNVLIGGAELISEVANGTGAAAGFNFTKVLCTHGVLPQLSRTLARSLGPRGLMPSAKRGTVVATGAEMQLAIREAQGAIDWRGDRNGVIRAAVGRIHFSEDQLRANMAAFMHGIIEKISLGLVNSGNASHALAQPSSAVGQLASAEMRRAKTIIKQIHLSSTQGPAVLIPHAEVL